MSKRKLPNYGPNRYLIYGLRDPRTGEIRYVGQSSKGLKRPWSHANASNLAGPWYVNRWIKDLLAKGFMFEVVVLQILEIGHLDVQGRKTALDEAERFWIKLGREALGRRFTNTTDGGGGTLGYVKPPEVRAKHSAALTGKKFSPERLAKLADRVATPEWKEYHRSVIVAAALTPEVNSRRIATRKALMATERGREIVEASHSPEANAKRSASLLKVYAAPEQKVQRSALSQKMWDSRSLEQRLEISRKGWDTRRKRYPKPEKKITKRVLLARAQWVGYTKEQRQEMVKPMQAALRAELETLTPEERRVYFRPKTKK